MDIPPPSVPEARLADWRQTDQTIDSPFSTPMVSAYTHTLVYEESTQRGQIHAQTGVDHPWRFFFSTRIHLNPPQPPNPVLSSLIRQRVDRSFVDRLADRGLTAITKAETHSVSLGSGRGKRTRFSARLTLELETTADPLSVPIEAYVTVWADGDYRLAGGAYPAGRADDGPADITAVLRRTIEPSTARKELFELVAGCCD